MRQGDGCSRKSGRFGSFLPSSLQGQFWGKRQGSPMLYPHLHERECTILGEEQENITTSCQWSEHNFIPTHQNNPSKTSLYWKEKSVLISISPAILLTWIVAASTSKTNIAARWTD
jgi:hypothetical protein